MIRGIMGRKAGMTRVFEEGHGMIAVSVIQAGPCFVTQVKSADTDGYEAVQIGFEESRKLNKGERGHLQKNGVPALRHLKEIRTDRRRKPRSGIRIDVGMFSVGDRVDVIGDQQGQGLRGRGQAPRLRRRPQDPRPVGPAPGARLDRLGHDSWACPEGHCGWPATWAMSGSP